MQRRRIIVIINNKPITGNRQEAQIPFRIEQGAKSGRELCLVQWSLVTRIRFLPDGLPRFSIPHLHLNLSHRPSGSSYLIFKNHLPTSFATTLVWCSVRRNIGVKYLHAVIVWLTYGYIVFTLCTIQHTRSFIGIFQ